jgi:hypothetical protein
MPANGVIICHVITLVHIPHMHVIVLCYGWLQSISILITEITLLEDDVYASACLHSGLSFHTMMSCIHATSHRLLLSNSVFQQWPQFILWTMYSGHCYTNVVKCQCAKICSNNGLGSHCCTTLCSNNGNDYQCATMTLVMWVAYLLGKLWLTDRQMYRSIRWPLTNGWVMKNKKRCDPRVYSICSCIPD